MYFMLTLLLQADECRHVDLHREKDAVLFLSSEIQKHQFFAIKTMTKMTLE